METKNRIYLTEKQVSDITRRAIQSLRNDRHKGHGIPYCKIFKSVRYCLDDVIEFMESRKIKTGDSPNSISCSSEGRTEI